MWYSNTVNGVLNTKLIRLKKDLDCVTRSESLPPPAENFFLTLIFLSLNGDSMKFPWEFKNDSLEFPGRKGSLKRMYSPQNVMTLSMYILNTGIYVDFKTVLKYHIPIKKWAEIFS